MPRALAELRAQSGRKSGAGGGGCSEAEERGDQGWPGGVRCPRVDRNETGAPWRQECDTFALHYDLGEFVSERHEPARGQRYRGGTSWVRVYRYGECHCITRSGVILHGPHVRMFGAWD
jgi:hypothetical protein